MQPDFKQKIKQTVERLTIRTLAEWTRYWDHSRLHDLNGRTLIILVILIFSISVLSVETLNPASDFPTEQYVTIEEGETLESLALVLEELHVVRSAQWLQILVRLRGGQHSVKAGDYSFSKPVGAFAIARIITTGAFGLEPQRILIPEGATVADMAIIYDRRLFKFDAEKA